MKKYVDNPQDNTRDKTHGTKTAKSVVGNERNVDMARAGAATRGNPGDKSTVGNSMLRDGVQSLQDNLTKGVPHQPLHGLRGK